MKLWRIDERVERLSSSCSCVWISINKLIDRFSLFFQSQKLFIFLSKRWEFYEKFFNQIEEKDSKKYGKINQSEKFDFSYSCVNVCACLMMLTWVDIICECGGGGGWGCWGDGCDEGCVGGDGRIVELFCNKQRKRQTCSNTANQATTIIN